MLNNALSGLNASNIALTVAGQNVSNAAVEGYSRQQAQFGTSNTQLGGVEVISVDRIVDEFLNDDIWRTNSNLSFFDNKQTYLGFIEEVLGTDSLDLNSSIETLTRALNSASTTPDSSAYRQQFISAAEGLLQDFAQLNGALSGQVSKMSAEMDSVAVNVTSLTEQIAELNGSIGKAIANGRPSAELKDNRERLVSELSEFVGVSVVERASGVIDISTPSGAPLVIGDKGSSITVTGTDISSHFLGQEFKLDAGVGGHFGGLISANRDVIEPTLASLNSLISDLADDVNVALSNGYDANNNPGIALFTYNPVDPLGSIAVNPNMGIDELAFKSSATSGPGDNGNIVDIISAMGTKGARFTSLVGTVGIQSKQNQTSIATASSLNGNAVLSRDSLSGVNLDEEAANLIHFQQMYSANAKVVSTADEMFNALLQMF